MEALPDDYDRVPADEPNPEEIYHESRLGPDLQAALVTLQAERADMASPERSLLISERGGGWSAATVRLWFHRLSTSLKMDGCSSHSGRAAPS